MDKKLLTFILLSSFFLVAVLGFVGMGHNNAHGGGCVAALSQGVNCPALVNPLAALQLHFNAFKSFSTAVLGNTTLAILLALLWSLIVPLLFKSGRIFADIPDDFSEEDIYDFLPPVSRKLLAWISFHEHSPTSLLRRG